MRGMLRKTRVFLNSFSGDILPIGGTFKLVFLNYIKCDEFRKLLGDRWVSRMFNEDIVSGY